MVRFQNRQWEIIGSVIRSRSPAPRCAFEARRLAQTTDRHDGAYYEWPIHLADEDWVDIEALNEAFETALHVFADRYAFDVDRDMLARSARQAIELGRDRRAGAAA